MRRLSRRDTVKTLGLGVLGMASLAGCSGTSASGGGEGGGDGSGAAEATPTPTETSVSEQPASGSTETAASSSSGDAKTAVDEWLSDVSNYAGIEDETGSSSVSVTVGAEGNGGNLAFGPAAIRVASGTTVTWEWNGKGSMHNVVDADGAFESDMVSEEGHTFSHEFTSAGVYTYSCTPHASLGMKGAVVVE
jgi:halocyanin-like protein